MTLTRATWVGVCLWLGACWLPVDRYRCTTDTDCITLPGGSCDAARGECTSSLDNVSSSSSSGGTSSGGSSSGGSSSSLGGASSATGSSGSSGVDGGAGADAGPPANLAPVVTEEELEVDPGATVTRTLTAVDPEGSAVTFALLSPADQGVATVDAVTGAFSYQANASSLGDDVVLVTATDTTGHTSLPARITIHIHTSINPTRTWLGTGVQNDNWFEADNWMPAGIPSDTDSVLIPAGAPHFPNVTNAATIRELQVDVGASVTLVTVQMQVRGSVHAPGEVKGDGELWVAGPNASLWGNFKKVLVRGGVTQVLGRTQMTQLTVILDVTQFHVRSSSVHVMGDLLVTDNALLAMERPAGQLVVDGSATFNGTANTARMSAGLLQLGSNLSYSFGFGTSGEHHLTLVGPRLHVVDGDHNTELQNLEMSGTGGASLYQDLRVKGGFWLHGSGSFSSTAAELTVDGVIQTEPGSTLNLASLASTWTTGLDLVAGTYSCTRTTYDGDDQHIATHLPYTDLAVSGRVTLRADGTPPLEIQRYLEVRGDGVLIVEGSVVVDQELRTYDTSRIEMSLPGAHVEVMETTRLDGNSMLGTLTNGTMLLHGDLWASTSGIRASDAHKVILEATTAQSITLQGAGTGVTYVGNLVVRGAHTVTLNDDLLVKAGLTVRDNARLTTASPHTLVVKGDLVVAMDGTVNVQRVELWAPSGTTQVQGALSPPVLAFLAPNATVAAIPGYQTVEILAADVLTTAAPTTIGGDLIIYQQPNLGPSGHLSLRGPVHVGGNCNIHDSDAILELGGKTLRCDHDLNTAGGATVLMRAGDTLVVGGNANLNAPAQDTDWTGGTLRISGNLTVADFALLPTVDHLVVMDGAGVITFAGNSDRLRNLTIASGGVVSVHPVASYNVVGTLTVEGSLEVPVGANLYVGALSVTGTLHANSNVSFPAPPPHSCNIAPTAQVTGYTCN